MEVEKKRREEEKKGDAKAAKPVQKSKRKKEDENRAILLKVDRRCVAKAAAREAQAERDDMCRAAHELKELLQKSN